MTEDHQAEEGVETLTEEESPMTEIKETTEEAVTPVSTVESLDIGIFLYLKARLTQV